MKLSERIRTIGTKDGAWGALADEVDKLEEENEKLEKKYYELIYAVASKHLGETRHDTALRYIQTAEKGSIEAMEEALLTGKESE